MLSWLVKDVHQIVLVDPIQNTGGLSLEALEDLMMPIVYSDIKINSLQESLIENTNLIFVLIAKNVHL